MSIEYILHLEQHLEPLILSWGTTIYWVIALIIFLESACILTPILPGDGLLFLLGFMASKHALYVDRIMAMLFFVTSIGYVINFYLGLKFGHYIRPKLGVRYQTYILQAENYYRRYDVVAIIMARFIPIVRTFVPFVTGLLKMSGRRFFWVNLTSASIWVISLVGLGWLAGTMNVMQSNLTWMVMCIMLISFTPVLYKVIKYIWVKHV